MLVRAATPSDAPSIFAVLAARDLADLGRVDASLDDVHADIERAEADLFVAQDGAEIVGAAVLDGRGSMVNVHPGAEGRGAGTALRAAVEQRSRARGLPERTAVAARNAAGIAHLAAAGYVRESEHLRLRGPVPRTPAADPRVERFDLDADGPAVAAVLDEGMAALGFSAERPYAAWRGQVERAVEPAFRLLARGDGDVAGAVVGERWDDGVGYVDELAVRPAAQGQGLGRALVQTLLVAFRDDGLTTAELSVRATNAPAIALYASLGLVEDFRQERWVRT